MNEGLTKLSRSAKIESPGWVKPSGVFYPCEYFQHATTAYYILFSNGLTKRELSNMDPYEELLLRGYVRVEKERQGFSILAENISDSRRLVGEIIRRLPMNTNNVLVEDNMGYYKKLTLLDQQFQNESPIHLNSGQN